MHFTVDHFDGIPQLLYIEYRIVQAFYVKMRPFTEQIATEAFSTGFVLVRYSL